MLIDYISALRRRKKRKKEKEGKKNNNKKHDFQTQEPRPSELYPTIAAHLQWKLRVLDTPSLRPAQKPQRNSSRGWQALCETYPSSRRWTPGYRPPQACPSRTWRTSRGRSSWILPRPWTSPAPPLCQPGSLARSTGFPRRQCTARGE